MKRNVSTQAIQQRFNISYDWPLTIKPYDIRLLANSTETRISENGDLMTEQDENFTLLAGRHWLSNPLAYPITVFFKLRLQNKSVDMTSDLIELEPGQYNTLGFRLEYDDVTMKNSADLVSFTA